MNRTSKREGLLYDVGMHKGEDTDFYLKKGFSVIGFEANPDLAAACRNRFAHELENGRLTIVEGAIVELPAGETATPTVKFYRHRNASDWGTVAPDWGRQNRTLGDDVVDVASVNFASCLETYGIPHYLKIDIEGMDIACLRALQTFEQRPDYVSIESERVTFGKLVDEWNLLTQLGYTGFKAVQQSGVSYQAEPKPSHEGMYVGGHQAQEGCSGLFGEDLPGTWKNYDQVLRQYRIIFKLYEWFGASGSLNGSLVVRGLRRVLSERLQRQIPGWYDTHARHSSVATKAHGKSGLE